MVFFPPNFKNISLHFLLVCPGSEGGLEVMTSLFLAGGVWALYLQVCLGGFAQGLFFNFLWLECDRPPPNFSGVFPPGVSQPRGSVVWSDISLGSSQSLVSQIFLCPPPPHYFHEAADHTVCSPQLFGILFFFSPFAFSFFPVLEVSVFMPSS